MPSGVRSTDGSSPSSTASGSFAPAVAARATRPPATSTESSGSSRANELSNRNSSVAATPITFKTRWSSRGKGAGRRSSYRPMQVVYDEDDRTEELAFVRDLTLAAKIDRTTGVLDTHLAGRATDFKKHNTFGRVSMATG